MQKEERQTFFEVGMSHDGDCGYRNFRQAWMTVAEKLSALRLIIFSFVWFRFLRA